MVKPLSDGTLPDSFSLKQSVIEQRLMHNEVLAVRLCSTVDAQMIKNNAGKQLFACKHCRKIPGKIISISQSKVIQFLKVVSSQLGN